VQLIINYATGLRAIVIGDIMLDHYIWGEASRLSPEAPVPIVNVLKDTYSMGGAANVSINLKTLGVLVEIIGIIGTDAAGDHLQNLFTENEIIFDEQQRVAGVETIVKTRIVAMQQQICRIDREKEDGRFALERIIDDPDDLLHNVDLVILSDYNKGALTQKFVTSIIDTAHKNHCFVAVDPKPQSGIIYAGADLLTPNAAEAMAMASARVLPSDEDGWREICKKINQIHPSKHLAITLGEDGILLAKNGQFLRIVPTHKVPVSDVSGAGDTVIAALSVALCAGAEPGDAAHFANTAAGIVVGKSGTATVSPAEIINREHQLAKK
jgi:D-beta-D-heptose 7-phosphate kinase/D-beta-D-heptose 1-phosphate adenosyltransferase